MKTISLADAHTILSKCGAVILDEGPLTYPCLSQLLDSKDKDAPDNEWLYINWEDEDGYEFFTKVTQGPNEGGVIVNESVMTLIDHEGDKIYLTVLVRANLE